MTKTREPGKCDCGKELYYTQFCAICVCGNHYALFKRMPNFIEGKDIFRKDDEKIESEEE